MMLKNYLLTIFYAVIWFVIGTACLLSTNAKWILLGIVLYVIGSVLVALATWYSLWDKFIEKTQAMQYLFDSARHLDNERLNSLLHALGLKPLPVKQIAPTKIDVNVTKRDNTGAMTEGRKYKDIPATPDQLKALADGLLNGIAFSRRQWTINRPVFTQDGFIKLQTYCLDKKNGLAETKGNGVEATDEFLDLLEEYAFPSPTPLTQPMEVAENQAI